MNIFDPKNNFEWHDYIRIIKRRKWYFILPFFLIIPLGIVKIIITQPLYESSCTVQIIPSRLLGSNLQRVVPGVIGRARIDALKKQITSSEYLLQLINILELKRNKKIQGQARKMHEKMQDKNFDEIVEFLLIDLLRELITIKQYSFDIIDIKLRAKTPEMSYIMVKTLTNIFIDESLRSEMGSVQNALQFNDEQITIFKEKLEKAERNLELYKKGQISNEVENQSLTSESMNRIREAIVSIDISTREKKDYLNHLSNQLKGSDNIQDYPKNDTIKKIQDNINEKIDQMAVLMERYSWKSAEVININRDINELRDRIKTEIQILYGLMYSNTPSQTLGLYLDKSITLFDLDILNRKNRELTKALDKFRRKVIQNPSRELTLKKLEEEVAINRKIYNMFLEQNQGAQIEESMQRADASSRFKIIEPPLKPLEPINAGYRMILLITIMMGTGLGAGAVYLREYLDKSVRTVQEAEEVFGIPVLGVLPFFNREHVSINQKKWLVYAIVSGIILIISILIVLYLKQ